MKALLSLLILTPRLLAGQDSTARRPVRFAGVEWSSSRTVAIQKMEAEGFKRVSSPKLTYPALDLAFDGKLMYYDARVYAFFTPSDALAKIQVLLLTPDAEVFDAYRKVVDNLTKKYGPPAEDVAYYKEPYKEADPQYQRETACKAGYCNIAAFWKGLLEGDLWVQITKALAVQVNYEGPSWNSEHDRRAADAAKQF